MKKLYYIDMIWVPIAVLTLGMRSLSKISDVSFVLIGWGLWTFIEYSVHRLLHKYVSPAHWDHHREPNGRHGPNALVTIGVLAWVYLLLLAIPIFSRQMADNFMAGFLAGYALYLYIHNGIHMTKILSKSKIRLRHEAHHRWENNTYGVTTTMWDKVFKGRR